MEQQIVKKYNYKLSPADKCEIYMEYLMNGPRALEVMKQKHGISKAMFYRLVKDPKNKELFDGCIDKLNSQFANKCSILIDKALKRIDKDLDDKNKEINLTQLATLTGILYDKSRLDRGMSTENKSVNVNIKID